MRSLKLGTIEEQMATRKNFPKRVDKRREDAKIRAESRAKRTNKQQLERLVNSGHGHCKEAQRLERGN